MAPQWQRQARKDVFIAGLVLNIGVKELVASKPVRLCSALMSSHDEVELTRVGHDLKRAAEFPVASCRASAHVEHVGSKRGEAFDVGDPGWSFYDSVASFILVLEMKNKDETKGKLTVYWNIRFFINRTANLTFS